MEAHIEKLQAFRTITMYLSHIRSIPPPSFPVVHPNYEKIGEVRLTNAFAQLAVTEHSVIAIAAMRDSEHLSIVACPSTSPPTFLPASRPPTPESVDSIYLKLPKAQEQEHERNPGLARNPFSELIDAVKPSHMGKESLAEYLAKLEDCWQPQMLETHLWILQQIPSLTFRELIGYIIVACNGKMLLRIGTSAKTNIFIDSLQTVLKGVQVTDAKAPTTYVGIERLVTPERYVVDKAFWKAMRPIDGLFGINLAKFPKLSQASEGRGPLYNITRIWSFALFRQLIAIFRENVEALGQHIAAQTPGMSPRVIVVMMVGASLCHLVHRHALQAFLLNISTLLPDPRQTSDFARLIDLPDSETSQSSNTEMYNVELEDVKADIQEIINRNSSSRSTMYLDWLKLFLTPFDAVKTVKAYSDRTHLTGAVEIKILLNPPVDSKYLASDVLFDKYIMDKDIKAYVDEFSKIPKALKRTATCLKQGNILHITQAFMDVGDHSYGLSVRCNRLIAEIQAAFRSCQGDNFSASEIATLQALVSELTAAVKTIFRSTSSY